MGFALRCLAIFLASALHSSVRVRGLSGPTSEKHKLQDYSEQTHSGSASVTKQQEVTTPTQFRMKISFAQDQKRDQTGKSICKFECFKITLYNLGSFSKFALKLMPLQTDKKEKPENYSDMWLDHSDEVFQIGIFL